VSLGEYLRHARVTLNLAQVEFAKLLGASQSAISRWENGTLEPSASQVYRLERLLYAHSAYARSVLKEFRRANKAP
jgi:transcriptional regulator with XRE-family HTH domain